MSRCSNCPMCGHPWDSDKCQTCGWSERLDPVNRVRFYAEADDEPRVIVKRGRPAKERP